MTTKDFILPLAALVVGCAGGEKPLYVPVPDGGVALIRTSASSNTRQVDVVVYEDGSAVRTVGEDGGYWVGEPNRGDGGLPTVLSMRYPPDAPEIRAFLADLARVGSVADIPIGTPCIKPISYGTRTVVSAQGETSGDLQCAERGSADVSTLADDCAALTQH
jgi:hypothetical protein